MAAERISVLDANWPRFARISFPTYILIWFDSIKVGCGDCRDFLFYFFPHVDESIFVYLYRILNVNFPASFSFVISCAIIYILFTEALFSCHFLLFSSFHFAPSTLASLVAFAWMSASFIRWNWLVFGLGMLATNDLLFSPQFRNNKNGFEMATATLSQVTSSDSWSEPNTTEDLGTHECALSSTAHYKCQCLPPHICYINRIFISLVVFV